MSYIVRYDIIESRSILVDRASVALMSYERTDVCMCI